MFKIHAIATSLFLVLTSTNAAYAQNDHGPTPNIEPAAVTRELRLRKEPRISDFTGLAVPRYASLRYDRVNGRAGPGFDYPVNWTYERTGLPVLVLRESREWTKIRDPEGDEVWVASYMLGARRTGITAANSQIHNEPDTQSRITAEIDVGVVTDLADCINEWCRIRVAGQKGWIPRDDVWGADELEE